MLNNHSWLEEQLNREYRRDTERHAEQERARKQHSDAQRRNSQTR